MSLLTPSFAASQTDNTIHVLIYLSRSHLGQQGVDVLTAGPQSSHDAGLGPSSASPIGVVVQGNIFGFRCAPYYLPLVFTGDLASSTPPAWRIVERAEDGADLVVEVTLTKANEGEEFVGLDELQAQYFPDAPGAGAQGAASTSKMGQAQQGFAGGTASRDEETGLINQMLGRAMAKEGLTTEDETMTGPATDGVTTVNASASFSSSPAHPQAIRPPRLPVIPLGTRSRCHKLFLTADKAAAAASPLSSPGVVLDDEGETQYRTGFAERMEDEKWDEAWYLDNYVDEAGEVAEVVRWKDPRSAAGGSAEEGIADQDVPLLLVLVELLFAHAYDRRTTMGDLGVESGWTIAMLCRSLVCSCPPSLTGEDLSSSLSATMRVSYRRALSMPLYRHWALAERVQQDVAETLSRGREGAKQALKEVGNAMGGAADEDLALGMYTEQLVVPLEVWVEQSVDEKSLLALSKAVAATRVTKEQVGGEMWDLEALEEAAKEALAEQQQQQGGQ